MFQSPVRGSALRKCWRVLPILGGAAAATCGPIQGSPEFLRLVNTISGGEPTLVRLSVPKIISECNGVQSKIGMAAMAPDRCSMQGRIFL
jgi:hypothetical protein